MLSPLFFRFGKYNVLMGLLCIAGGFFIGTVQGPVWLLPFGVHYTPLIPWFGAVLVGIGVGEFLYAGGVRQFAAPQMPDLLIRPLAFLGRYSLIIYLVHQPVIILLLAAVTGTKVL